MKKYLSITLIASAFFALLSAEEAIVEFPKEETFLLIDFVDIRDAKADELLNIMEGRIENIALHFPKGVSLPLRANIGGDLLELEHTDQNLSIQVKKDFYLRVNNGEFLFSSDLQQWEEMGAFITGSLTAGLIKDESEPIFALVEAQINERK